MAAGQEHRRIEGRRPMTEPIKITELRATAEQIEKACPERLKQIGKEITERLKKADKQTELAQNHLIAVEQLLAEAKSLCDDSGFEKFRELVCPQLGKSQAYALLAIAAGKKTLAEHRIEERERKRRTRTKQKAAANSGTVPEKPEPATAPDNAPEATSSDTVGVEQSAQLEPLKRDLSITSAPNRELEEFNNHVTRLMQMIKGAEPRWFIKAPIKADDLAKLSAFFSGIAMLKSKSTPHFVPQGSPEIPLEDRKTQHEALEAADGRETA